MLEISALQGEAGPDLLQFALGAFIFEVVPVMPEEDKVALIVERYRSSPPEVRHLWEKGCKLSA